jgi:hypothetical protein
MARIYGLIIIVTAKMSNVHPIKVGITIKSLLIINAPIPMEYPSSKPSIGIKKRFIYLSEM